VPKNWANNVGYPTSETHHHHCRNGSRPIDWL